MARAAATPAAGALTYLAQGETPADTRTVGDLDQQSSAVASLLGRHAAPGDRALLVFPPGLDFVAAFLGCLAAGVIAVPAPLPGGGRSNRGRRRLASIAADAAPRVTLSTRDAMPRGLVPGHVIATDVESLPDPDRAPVTPAPDDVAFLQYTSGSTAEPRGVMVTHGNLASNLAAASLLAGPRGRGTSVTWLPHTHDMGLIQGLLQPIWDGTPAYIMAPTAFLQRPARWLEAISRHQAVRSGGPNFAFGLAAARVTDSERRRLDLTHWRAAFCGAEPIRADTLRRFAAVFAGAGFQPDALRPAYGLAEATLLVTSARWQGLERGHVPCGGPAPPTSILIVDPETGRRLPDGDVGEIWVQGPGVAAGYWRQPDATAATFGLSAEGHSGRFLRTGDLGCVDRNQLIVTGRLKDLLIVRGVKHYPQDLELTAELADTAVRPGSPVAFSIGADEAGDRIVMVGETDRARGVDIAQRTIDAVRTAVATQHGVQLQAIALVRPGSVPRTTSGKRQRYRCREAWLRRAWPIVADWQVADAMVRAS